MFGVNSSLTDGGFCCFRVQHVVYLGPSLCRSFSLLFRMAIPAYTGIVVIGSYIMESHSEKYEFLSRVMSL